MAGSKVWRPYVATVPDEQEFSILIDESNARATYLGQELVPAAPLSPILKPGALRLRTITAELDAQPLIRRKFAVANQDLWIIIGTDPDPIIQAAVSQNVDDSAPLVSQWRVVFLNYERYTRRAKARDTYLRDGTPAN